MVTVPSKINFFNSCIEALIIAIFKVSISWKVSICFYLNAAILSSNYFFLSKQTYRHLFFIPIVFIACTDL